MDSNVEIEYLKLLYDVFKNGELKEGRNGKTRSVFGRQIRHDMKLGFPLLTTKKMYWKGIVAELLWFLRGDTNIKFLLDNDVHIWDGDAYKNYEKNVKESIDRATVDGILKKDDCEDYSILSKETFINRIKIDDDFAKQFGDLGPIYGKQWRGWKTEKYKKFFNKYGYEDEKRIYIDQIADLIRDLKTNPDSRRLMVSAWNPGELDQMVLPPCHYGFQVYTRELCSGERRDWVIKNRSQQMPKFFDRLGWEGNVDKVLEEFNAPTRAISLMWNQRSADVFLGLPFNIASYGLLLEIIAKEVNMVPDELVGNIGDAHLYLNHIEQAKEQLHRELYPLPKIMFKDHLKDFDSIIDILRINDFILDGYQSHPTIKAPLSN